MRQTRARHSASLEPKGQMEGGRGQVEVAKELIRGQGARGGGRGGGRRQRSRGRWRCGECCRVGGRQGEGRQLPFVAVPGAYVPRAAMSVTNVLLTWALQYEVKWGSGPGQEPHTPKTPPLSHIYNRYLP